MGFRKLPKDTVYPKPGLGDNMRLVLSTALILGLTACATVPTPETVEPKTGISATVVKTGLPAQTLKSGDCALFVWTADAKRRFILFSQAKSRSGLWHNGGEDIAISISDQAGTPANRQFPAVDYDAADASALMLNLQDREPIVDGTRFKAGTLQIVKADGWNRVMPVVGLSACQTQ